jgi:hypothetical protein
MKRRVALILLSFVAACAGGGAAAPASGAGGDEKVCEVHRVPLVGGTARVTRGLPDLPPAGYYKARDKKFPNSNREVNDGCVIDLTQPGAIRSEAQVTYCPKCRAAEEGWLRKHRRK